MTRRPLHCSVALLLLLAAAVASGVPAGGLTVARRVERGVVVAEVRAQGIVDDSLRERLQSGLTNRLVIEAKLVPEGFGPPLYSATRIIEVVYDLWDERYLIEVRGGGPDLTLRAINLDEVTELLQAPRQVEIGAAGRCEPRRAYRVDATLTVNPVSAQVLQQSREMLSPSPGPRGGASSRSLFGSVARIFFNVSADPGVRVLRGLSPFSPITGTPEGER